MKKIFKLSIGLIGFLSAGVGFYRVVVGADDGPSWIIFGLIILGLLYWFSDDDE